MGGEREPQHTCQACSGGSVSSVPYVCGPSSKTQHAASMSVLRHYSITVSRPTVSRPPDTHPPHHSQCWHCPPPPPLRCQSRAGSRARPAPPFASAQPIERCPLRREQPEQRHEVVGRSATAQQHSFSSGGAANEPAAGVASDGGVAVCSDVEGHAPVGGARASSLSAARLPTKAGRMTLQDPCAASSQRARRSRRRETLGAARRLSRESRESRSG